MNVISDKANINQREYNIILTFNRFTNFAFFQLIHLILFSIFLL